MDERPIKPPVQRSRRGRKLGEITTAIPLLRKILEIAHAQGLTDVEMARRIKGAPDQIRHYRHGKHEPRLATLEEMARAVGYRLALEPIDKQD